MSAEFAGTSSRSRFPHSHNVEHLFRGGHAPGDSVPGFADLEPLPSSLTFVADTHWLDESMRSMTSSGPWTTSGSTSQGQQLVQKQNWNPNDWRLAGHSLALEDLRSSTFHDKGFLPGEKINAIDDAVQLRNAGAVRVMPGVPSGVEPGAVPSTGRVSQREMTRRLRKERAEQKKKKHAELREKLLLNGAKCCDVIGCFEPQVSTTKRICTLHKGATELMLEGEAELHRWCMYCHCVHPITAFGEQSRTICSVKFELRKRRKAQCEKAGTPSTWVQMFADAELRMPSSKRARVNTANSENRQSSFSEEHGTSDGGSNQTAATTAVMSAPRAPPPVNNDDELADFIAELVGEIDSYNTRFEYSVMDIKVPMNPDVLAHEHVGNFVGDAMAAAKSLHPKSNGGTSHSEVGMAALGRIGTPAVEGMMPGCTQVTVSNMMPLSSRVSNRERITHMIDELGASKLLQDERWGSTIATTGDETSQNNVYCAAAVGNVIAAEYKGLPWPTAVWTPLCVVAGSEVSLNLSSLQEPSGVRWLGHGINKKTRASARMPIVTCQVPDSTSCCLLSVQMLRNDECMGQEFKHILVLPSGDRAYEQITAEINRLQLLIEDAASRQSDNVYLSGMVKRFYHIVTTDLVWLLTTHESGAVYDNAATLEEARSIVWTLSHFLNSKFKCPALEGHLNYIRDDLASYTRDDIVERDIPQVSTEYSRQRTHTTPCENQITWTWLHGYSSNGIKLGDVENKYQHDKFLLSDSLMVFTRTIGGLLYMAVHYKFMEVESETLAPQVLHDVRVSMLVILLGLLATHVFQRTVGKTQWLYRIYPYDGVFWALLFDSIVLHDMATTYVLGHSVARSLKPFTFFVTSLMFRMTPLLFLSMFPLATAFSFLKASFILSRWEIKSAPGEEFVTHSLVYFRAWVFWAVILACIEIRDRHSFIASQKFNAWKWPKID